MVKSGSSPDNATTTTKEVPILKIQTHIDLGAASLCVEAVGIPFVATGGFGSADLTTA